MKERPIIFSGPMVRALLDGRKVQTRRIVKHRHLGFIGGNGEENDPAAWGFWADNIDGWAVLARGMDDTDLNGRVSIPCPHGDVGDRLWVKETWQKFDPDVDPVDQTRLGPSCPLPGCEGSRTIHWRAAYRADGELSHPQHGPATWRPSLFMPRWASRILLEVTEVRVQRLQEISEADAKAEGVEPFFTRFPEVGRDQRLTTGELASDAEHRASFAVLWDEINGDRALWSTSPWVWAISFRRVETK